MPLSFRRFGFSPFRVFSVFLVVPELLISDRPRHKTVKETSKSTSRRTIGSGISTPPVRMVRRNQEVQMLECCFSTRNFELVSRRLVHPRWRFPRTTRHSAVHQLRRKCSDGEFSWGVCCTFVALRHTLLYFCCTSTHFVVLNNCKCKF